MGEAFIGFLDTVKNGTYGFEQIFAYIAELWSSIFASEHISATVQWLNTTLSVIIPYLPYALVAIYAIVWLFGKRLLGVIRFVVFFLAGYLLGTYYFADTVIGYFPSIPAFAVGLAVAIVIAVLSKILYFVVYTVVVGYGMYLLCIGGTILPEIKDNYIVGLIVAAIAILLAFVLRNYIERMGTAFLGAYGALTIVKGWYDFTALVPGYERIVLIVACAVLTLIGFAVQQATKKKKY